MSAYYQMYGLRIPTQASAAWVIGGEEKPYARLTLCEIEYDQPYVYS
ncbi:hypothetical protein SAMN05216167_102367 [Spirosoma endophyticum]|uniref:Uncharacterized protein n=1 Tax=Spirosoma endophyticum TaxID=662367 RepID=A0A1I1M212_9BACT|nr:hypothetical protein SAMN05216167_102367 [Spirosoma endophyticum]